MAFPSSQKVALLALTVAAGLGACSAKSPGNGSTSGTGGIGGPGGSGGTPPARTGGSGGGATNAGGNAGSAPNPGGSGGNATNTGGSPGTGGQTTPPGTGGATAPTDMRPANEVPSAETAPPDAPATGAPCVAPALLCEDFEGYAPGSNLGPTWTTDLVGGTLGVDSTKPFAGTKGLHIKANANASSLLQIVKQGAPVFPLAKNAFYGRMMIWIAQQPTGAVHFNTVQANGLLPGSAQIAKYAYGAMYARFMAGYTVRNNETATPTIDCGKSGTSGYPEKSWVCAEWQFDGPANEMRYWINGQAQTSVDVIKVGGGCTGTQPAGGVWQAPVFNKLMLGWYAQPFPTAIDVWIDDVIVSTERVGCPKP